MSAFSASHDNWLNLKHRTKPSCVYGLGYGTRDSDWDFADTPSRGYSFASEDSPIQLLNNNGGMDEDNVVIKDVWYPHQPMPVSEEVDSEMSDLHSSGDDMEMEMESPIHDTPVDCQQQQQQLQFPQNVIGSTPTINKRKRGTEALELSSGMAANEYQQISLESFKRVRVGA